MVVTAEMTKKDCRSRNRECWFSQMLGTSTHGILYATEGAFNWYADIEYQQLGQQQVARACTHEVVHQ